MRFDFGWEFNADEFYEYLRQNDIEPVGAASQGHWQVGSVERMNGLLKENLKALMESFPSQDLDILLQEAVNAHNQLSTHKGLPPCVRVFGQIPRIPGVIETRNEASLLDRETLDAGTARVALLRQTAREVYVQLQASNKLKTAVARNLRPGPKHVVKMHDKVMYYRVHNQNKAYTGWHGPGYVCGLDRGAVLIRHGSRVFSVPPNYVRATSNSTLPETELALDELRNPEQINLVGLDGSSVEIEINVEQAIQELRPDAERRDIDVSRDLSQERQTDESSTQRVEDHPTNESSPRPVEDVPSVVPRKRSREHDEQVSKRQKSPRISDPDEIERRFAALREESKRQDRQRYEEEVQKSGLLRRTPAPKQKPAGGTGRPRGRPPGSKNKKPSEASKQRKPSRATRRPSMTAPRSMTPKQKKGKLTTSDPNFCEASKQDLTVNDGVSKAYVTLSAEDFGRLAKGMQTSTNWSKHLHDDLQTILEPDETFVDAFDAEAMTPDAFALSTTTQSSKDASQLSMDTASKTRDASQMKMSKTKTVPASQATGPKWDMTRKAEFQHLLDHRSFDCLKKHNVIRDKNVSSVRDLNVMHMLWVFTIKPDGRYKARLCVQGSADKDKGKILSASPTLTRESFRMILFILAQMHWECMSGDVPQAFLKADEEFWDREIYCIPPPMMGFEPDDILKLRKCVYGLIDAPLQWWATVDDWMAQHGLERSQFDPSVFILKNDTNGIEGVVGVAVDDTLWGGTSKMKTKMDEFAKRFSIKEWESALGTSRKFLGHDVIQNKDFSIEVDQIAYIHEHAKPIEIADHRKNLAEITPCTQEEVKQLQQANGVGIWVIAQTRADTACQISNVAGEIGRSPTIGTIRRLNTAIATLRSRTVKMVYKRVGKNAHDFELPVFHDAAFGNLPEGGSQGGVPLLAVPKNSIRQDDFLSETAKEIECVPLFWKSFRLRRVARSTFAGETLSAVEALDIGQYFRECLGDVTGMNVKCTQVTDCKSLKDNVDSIVPKCSEKSLKRDIHAIRETVMTGFLHQFLWCDTKHMIADGLTKLMDVGDILRLFEYGSIRVGQSAEQAEKTRKRKEKQALRANRKRYWESMKNLLCLRR